MIGKTGHDDIRLADMPLGIGDDVGGDVDAPLSQDFFETGIARGQSIIY
jgi:hypothetical protein